MTATFTIKGSKKTKEFDKLKDRKDMVEVRIPPRLGGDPDLAAQPQLHDRLEALEAAVTRLLGMLPGTDSGSHFIGTDLRPDVGATAYDPEQSPDDGASTDGRGKPGTRG